MSENFQKLVKRDIECDLEKKIDEDDEDDEEAKNGVDKIDIFLDVVGQHQQSGYILPIWYDKGGISVREGLIFNDPEDTAYDLEEEMQDVLDWEQSIYFIY